MQPQKSCTVTGFDKGKLTMKKKTHPTPFKKKKLSSNPTLQLKIIEILEEKKSQLLLS